LSLVEPLLNKDRTLWMDNFYNSPAMAQRLKSLKTDCVGTLCLTRKDVPQRVKDKTVFWCPKCEAALCVEESFKAFHTKLNFSGKILLHI